MAHLSKSVRPNYELIEMIVGLYILGSDKIRGSIRKCFELVGDMGDKI